MSTFHQFNLKGIHGNTVDFNTFKDKKVLLVNTASACRYTAQYEHIQAFHEKYGEQLIVLGFPANNFGGQEPGSNQEIAHFCVTNYQVNFQLFEKISVVGVDQHPLYQFLAKAVNQQPTWNFCKYLVDEAGEVVEFFPANVSPFDNAIMKHVHELA